MLTIYGACAVTFMMCMYALESRDPRFVLAFALGCALSSSYGFLSGTWPFGVVEGVWTLVAIKRFLDQRRSPAQPEPASADPSRLSVPRRSGRSAVIESDRSDVS